MRRYLDEYIEPKERQWLSPFDNIAKNILKQHNEGKTIEQIIEYIEEKYYVFNDDERERQWYKEVIENVINKKQVKNRFTGYTYELEI